MLAPAAVAGSCVTALGCGRWDPARACVACVRLRGTCVRAQEANAGRTAAGATGAREVSVERAGVAVRRLGGGRAPLSWSSLLGSWVRAPKPRVPLTPLWSAPPTSCHALGSGLPSWSQLVLEARDQGPESLDYLGERPMRGRRNPSCPASRAVSLGGWPGCPRGRGEAENTVGKPVDLQQARREEHTFQAGKGLRSSG